MSFLRFVTSPGWRYCIASVLLAGCSGYPQDEYGVVYSEGEMLATACAVVKSFSPWLHSAPRAHGPDTFVGYYSHGPGLPRGHVFLVMPTPSLSPHSVGHLLQFGDPHQRSFWLDAILLKGDYQYGKPFEAVVPALEHSPSPNATIVERQTILVRAQIHSACGKHYLVAVQGNPFISEKDEWPRIRSNFELFMANLEWPR